jgi:hypothetical protein
VAVLVGLHYEGFRTNQTAEKERALPTDSGGDTMAFSKHPKPAMSEHAVGFKLSGTNAWHMIKIISLSECWFLSVENFTYDLPF